MNVDERVHGYTGADGLVQAVATGYFIYDIIVSTYYISLFGLGFFFHAVCALCVFSFGFVSYQFRITPLLFQDITSPYLLTL